MILENNFKKNLLEINSDLSKYYNLTKPQIFESFIRDKLKANLELYNYKLTETSDYLLHQGSRRVLKAILKIKKNNDKDIIKQNLIDKEK